MKPFNALATAAVVIGGAFIAAPYALAQCRNGWCKADCSGSYCAYIKLENRGYPVRRALLRDRGKELLVDYDCQRYRTRFVNTYGINAPYLFAWKEEMQGTIGDYRLKVVCNM